MDLDPDRIRVDPYKREFAGCLDEHGGNEAVTLSDAFNRVGG